MNHPIFGYTHIGSLHLREKKPCQDYSIAKKYKSYSIIGVADGHGSSLYIRSQSGSKFALQALLMIANQFLINEANINICEESIKINYINRWNQLVIEHIQSHPISEKEIEQLSQKQKLQILMDPYVIYGTTFIGCIVYKEKLVLMQIGDGALTVLDKNNDFSILFHDRSDLHVGGYTSSLSQDNAIDYLDVKIISKDEIKYVCLATDGFLIPFMSEDRLLKQFFHIYQNYFQGDNKKSAEIEIKRMLHSIAFQYGNGDDVSFAYLII